MRGVVDRFRHVPSHIAIAKRLEAAQCELELARELAREHGDREAYTWLASRIGEIDAMRSVFAERKAADD